MAELPATRLANPRVGLYVGIFASLLLGLGLMALLVEALGAGPRTVAMLLLAGPLALYAGFGMAVATRHPHDFFAAGRRVPAFIAGSTMALATLGGTGVVALTGALFLMGSDAFAILLGLPAGLLVAGVLFAPFLRKFGAYTVPGYLGVRLDSRLIQIAAAAVFALPASLLIVAELALARQLVGQVLGTAPGIAAALVTLALLLLSLAGGMRAVVWSSAATMIAAIVALVIPVTIAALYLSNVPIPQLTAGNMARGILRTELFRDVPQLIAAPWLVDLPGPELEVLGRRFLQMFGSVGESAYGLITLIVLAGVAGLPGLLQRPTTTPSVGASRVSITWAVIVLAFLVLTIAAIAIYARALVTDQVLGTQADRLPGWFQSWIRQGIAAVDAKGSTPVSLAAISVRRDDIFAALPQALGLPWSIVAVSLVGALAACLGAAATHLQTLAASISEDLVLGRDPELHAPMTRLFAARATLVVTALGLTAASLLPLDPLMLFMWALAIAASTSFPLLVLSVLWKRLTPAGALAGLTVGLAAVLAPSLLPGGVLGAVPLPLSAALAIPLAFAAAIGLSFLTPAISRNAHELLRDMRVPGGETLMDRQRRLLRLKRGD